MTEDHYPGTELIEHQQLVHAILNEDLHMRQGLAKWMPRLSAAQTRIVGLVFIT